MEKGYYSVDHLKLMILDKDKTYYFIDYDPYNNYMEIEFNIGEINSENMIVIVKKFYATWLDKVVILEHPTSFKIKSHDFKKIKTYSKFL